MDPNDPWNPNSRTPPPPTQEVMNFEDMSEDDMSDMGDDGLGVAEYKSPPQNPNTRLWQQAPRPPPIVEQPQAPTLAQRAEAKAQRLIDRGKVPDIDGWDWLPFMSAIFERDTQVPLDDEDAAINFVESDDDDSDDGDDTDETESSFAGGIEYSNQPTQIPSTLEPGQRPPKGPRSTASNSHRPPIHMGKPPPKQPGDGSWNFVMYVPEWSDPAWDPAWERIYGTNRKRPRFQRDVMQTLRPALRAEDLVRNPTPYARRWGIPADRTDGRSRTSPTFSGTRDYSAAIDDEVVARTMDEATRAQCLAETQRRIAQGQTAYRGPGIAPEVMDEYRKRVGIPSQEDIRKGAVAMGVPFERYIETLPQAVRDIYRSLIDDVLDDEDYQRILFSDMTSDEMYRNNIFTMSNDEKYTLTDIPLHPLIAKDKWEDTLYKGAIMEHPRLVYDFWGKREEYDVHRNPAIWAALQPALQLVTRVLHTNPAFWRSLKDLRTRRKIEPELDPRGPDHQPTPYLPKMIRQDEIRSRGDDGYAEDLHSRWPELDALAAAGFDYAHHVDWILGRHVEIGLGTAFLDDKGETTNFTYGRTSLHVAGLDTKILVEVSSELVWPLLNPDYSSSEKLCVSYVVATTLLHELMHATSYAVDVMCLQQFACYPPTQTVAISNRLYRWWTSACDPDAGYGEPWWRDDLRCEVGWAFEKEFWGDSVVLASGGANAYRLSKHVLSLPLALISERHPSGTYGAGNDVLLGYFPVEEYYRPISIDYYAKFFTDQFWQVDWPRHGGAAFKRLPPDRQHLCLMIPTWQPEGIMRNIFGANNWRFFRVIIRALRRYGFPILAEYCNQLVWEGRGFHSLRNRWLRDVQTWQYADRKWEALTARLDKITEEVEIKWEAVSSPTEALYQEWMSDKLPPYPSMAQWHTIMQHQFLGLTKDGGPYFAAIEAVHQMAQDELRVMERIVYEFLTVQKGQRRYIYRPDQVSDPLLMLVDRMVSYKDAVEVAHDALDNLHGWAPLASETDRIASWCAWLDQDATRLAHLSDLVLMEHQVDDDRAKTVREGMKSVPSALYEKRANRLRKLAMKEYTVLDPRIRNGLDEMYQKLEGWVGQMARPVEVGQNSAAAQARIAQLQQRLQKSGKDKDTLGKPMDSVSPRRSSNIFSFKNPGAQNVAVPGALNRVDSRMGRPDIQAPSRIGTSRRDSNGSVFGQSWNPASPPRRTMGPRLSVSAEAFSKYSNLQSALGDAPAKFQGNFSSQVNVIPPPASASGGLQVPGRGNPFASTSAPGATPFPFPYADRNMVTSDLAYVTQNPTPAFQHLLNALQASNAPFRDTRKDDDSDTEMGSIS